MRGADRHTRMIAALLAATVLGGCGNLNALNPLLLIDDPFVPPSQRQRVAEPVPVPATEAVVEELEAEAIASAPEQAGQAEPVAAEPQEELSLLPAAGDDSPPMERLAGARVEPALAVEMQVAEEPFAAEETVAAPQAEVRADPAFIGPVLPEAEMRELGAAVAPAPALSMPPAASGTQADGAATAAELATILPAEEPPAADPSEPVVVAALDPAGIEPEEQAELSIAEPAAPEPVAASLPEPVEQAATQEAEQALVEATPQEVLPQELAPEPAASEASLVGPDFLDMGVPPMAGEAAELEEEERVSLIGPDFLPPEEPETPAGAALVEVAPEDTAPAVSSTGSDALVGPVLVEDEPAPVAADTGLASAFDFEFAEDEAGELPASATATVEATPTALAPGEAVEDAPALTVAGAAGPPPLAETLAPPEPAMEEDPEPLALSAPETPPALAPEPVAEAAAPAPQPQSEMERGELEQSELEREAAALGFAVVGGMPAPGEPAPGLASPSPARTRGADVYADFYDFTMGKLEELSRSGPHTSMLLLDPPSLDPELQRCGNLPPAVLIDLDPGSGLLPLVGNNRPNPVLAGYLAVLRQRGVTIYWISGHGPEAASRIRGILRDTALDPAGIDPLIVTRFAGESKQNRRYGLGESNCLLAIIGDQRGDFDELYDFVLDPIMAAPLEDHVGEGWFLAPPPIN